MQGDGTCDGLCRVAVAQLFGACPNVIGVENYNFFLSYYINLYVACVT